MALKPADGMSPNTSTVKRRIFAYIEAAFGDGDPALIKHALGDVARALGMTAITKEAGVTRAALYKALSDEGDPRMSTLMA